MTARRLAAPALTLLLLASACGDDGAERVSPTTVPVPADTTPPDPAPDPTTAEPDEPDEAPIESTTTVAPDGDLETASVRVEELVVLDSPIDTAAAANGELWIAQRGGRIVVVDPTTGEVGATVLDISAETTTDSERGLLGLAVDDTHLFVNFTDLDGNTHVDAFTLDEEGRPGPRRGLLVIEQPFRNHNGGGLAIGPDGLLYIGVGDGGAANDPLGAGQDPTQLLGSILRIDPTPADDDPYIIPADNPFADGVAGRPEIFLTGARNPWRFTFDPQTDDLWVADVGQNEIEEIDLMLGSDGWGLGANLGWNLREGTAEFTGPRPDNNVDPVFEYRHDGPSPTGCSVSGGRVYRGSAVPELVGAYVFGDYCTGRLWAISTAGGAVTFADLDADVGRLVGITTDAEGELLTLSLDGEVNRVVPG